jgi:hypothetical protein
MLPAHHSADHGMQWSSWARKHSRGTGMQLQSWGSVASFKPSEARSKFYRAALRAIPGYTHISLKAPGRGLLFLFIIAPFSFVRFSFPAAPLLFTPLPPILLFSSCSYFLPLPALSLPFPPPSPSIIFPSFPL